MYAYFLFLHVCLHIIIQSFWISLEASGRICDCFKGIRKDTSFMHSEVQISIL